MKPLLIILMFVSFTLARENSNLTSIYAEFTETVTVKYQRTIKLKANYSNTQHHTRYKRI